MVNRLGLDVGFSETGFALLDIDDYNLLAWGEMNHRNIKRGKTVSDRMEERSNARSTRRSRLWYRPERFDNRKRNSVYMGEWLNPTMRSHVAAHFKLIRLLLNNYSIDEITIEVGQFDPHRLKKGRPMASWEYQRGEGYGYENKKQYVRDRDKYTCQYCGGDGGTIDHVYPQSRFPELKNNVKNMVCSCKECNKKKGDKTAGEWGKKKLQKKIDGLLDKNDRNFLSDATGMNILNKKLMEGLKSRYLYVEDEEQCKHQGFYIDKEGNVVNDDTDNAKYNFNPEIKETFGFITREDRKDIGWAKTHRHDAVTIASVGEKVDLLSQYLKIRWMGRPQRKVYRDKVYEGGELKYNVAYNNVKVDGKVFNRGDLVEYTDRKGDTYRGFIQSFFKGKRARVTGVDGNTDPQKWLKSMCITGDPGRSSFPVAKLSGMKKIASSPRLRYSMVSNE